MDHRAVLRAAGRSTRWRVSEEEVAFARLFRPLLPRSRLGRDRVHYGGSRNTGRTVHHRSCENRSHGDDLRLTIDSLTEQYERA